ncbi:MAG: metallophosphoesterase [Sarcina sp.]
MEEKLKRGLIRDCLNKLDKLSDDSWEDIVERYELDLNPHELRKRSYGMKMAYGTLADSLENDSSEQLLEIKKEKIKLSDLRSCVQKDIRQLSKVENVIDLIIEECKQIDDFKFIDNNKIEIHPNGNKANLLISDLHYDGSDVPVRRFNELIDVTINKCKFHGITQLNVLFGGDLINNELKTTIRLENQEGVSNQLVGVCKLISEGIYKLSKNVPMITYAIVTGNHERSIENYKLSMTTSHYLPIINELVEFRVSDLHNVVKLDNVVIEGEVDDRFCVFKIDDKVHVLTHGDALKNIEKSALNTVENYIGLKLKIDYLYIGHFHSDKSFSSYDSNVICNGYCGKQSDYGKKLLLRNPPVQKLMILNGGDVECTYNIKLAM